MASSSKEQELAIKIAGKVENSFKQSLGVTEDGLNKIASVAKKAAAVAAAAFAAVKVGDFISGAVDEYAEFEQAMANTSAIAGASADDYAKLSAAAREAGKATTFTASEAADALGYMALAGWNVEESTAALTPVLKLAEATQADLATTSDQVTDSMSAMGVGIDDLQGYLDVIVTTNNKANTTAADLMDAFIGCGGAARAAGMNYKETSTALGILANNGIKGSEAGTALNSMLVRISTKDVAQKAFKDLGVAVYDSSGEMRNMRDILVDLNGAMAGMTQEQKNSYMSAIAGTNYYSQFGYLLDGVKEGVNGSASAWDELAGAIDNSTGALDAMDATATGTLQGALARFQSAISDLKISMVEDFGPYAMQIIDAVALKIPDITAGFSELIQKLPIQEFMNGVGQMAGGVLDFVGKIVDGQSFSEAFSSTLAEDFGVELPGSVQTFLGVIQNLWDDFQSFMGRIGNFGKLIVFETSDSRILNFTDYQRTISANWAKHERIGKKPQSEFLNPELMTVQFKVVLNAQHGVKPWKTFHEITKAVQQGRVEKLVIGNHAVGSNRWKITQATQSNLVVMGTGEIQKMDVNLSLEEYL